MPKSPKPSVCDLTSSRVHPTTSAVGVHKDTISEVCRKSASWPESDKPAAAQAVIAEAAGVPRQTITDTLPKMAGLPEVGKSIPTGGSAVWGKTDLLPKMEGLPDSAKPAVADSFGDFGMSADFPKSSASPDKSEAAGCDQATVARGIMQFGELADLHKPAAAADGFVDFGKLADSHKPAASQHKSAEAAGIPQRTVADVLADSEDLPNPLKPDLCSESAELPESNKPAASPAEIAEAADVVLGETADLPKFLKANSAASQHLKMIRTCQLIPNRFRHEFRNRFRLLVSPARKRRLPEM